MNIPANDIGPGLTRKLCDRCKKPVFLCWKGRDGEYCSNECKKAAEKENQMTSDSNSPVTGGATAAAPAKKSTAKKGAAKKTAAPKAKRAASAGSRSKIDDASVIKFKDFDASKFRGKQGERAKLMKEGITVRAFVDKVAKNDDTGGMSFVNYMLSKGNITLTKPAS